MRITIGSKNKAKISAVEEFFSELADEQQYAFTSMAATSLVSDQPITMEETIIGAKNRSRHALDENPGTDLAVGLEGGLTEVTESHTGYLNICAASFYDGKDFYIGLSSGFEHPKAVIHAVTVNGLEIRDAYIAAGFENSTDFSQEGGAIGYMTNQRISRKEYCKQALETAYGSYLNRAKIIAR